MPVEHRKTPSRRVFVPPGWFIVLTALVCLGSAGWLGWLVLEQDRGNTTVTTGESPTTTATSEPTPTPTETSATTEPTTEPTPAETEEEPEPTDPVEQRDAPVAVLNNTSVAGLAGTFAARVRSAGWTVAGVGNWRGSIPSNTVYYPPGLVDQANLLAQDVGIGRVRPSVAPMRTDRLTVILSGPQ